MMTVTGKVNGALAFARSLVLRALHVTAICNDPSSAALFL